MGVDLDNNITTGSKHFWKFIWIFVFLRFNVSQKSLSESPSIICKRFKYDLKKDFVPLEMCWQGREGYFFLLIEVIMLITKNVLLNWYSSMKKKIEKYFDNFWHKKLTLKVKFWHFLTPPHYTNSQNSIISFGYVDF